MAFLRSMFRRARSRAYASPPAAASISPQARGTTGIRAPVVLALRLYEGCAIPDLDFFIERELTRPGGASRCCGAPITPYAAETRRETDGQGSGRAGYGPSPGPNRQCRAPSRDARPASFPPDIAASSARSRRLGRKPGRHSCDPSCAARPPRSPSRPPPARRRAVAHDLEPGEQADPVPLRDFGDQIFHRRRRGRSEDARGVLQVHQHDVGRALLDYRDAAPQHVALDGRIEPAQRRIRPDLPYRQIGSSATTSCSRRTISSGASSPPMPRLMTRMSVSGKRLRSSASSRLG